MKCFALAGIGTAGFALSVVLAIATVFSIFDRDISGSPALTSEVSEFVPMPAIQARPNARLEEIKSQKMPSAPEDGQKLHLSLILPLGANAQADALREFFERSECLAIAQRCHYHEYPVDNAIYKERLQSVVPSHLAPGVILQAASGKVLYKSTAADTPRASSDLYAALVTAAGQAIANGSCPPGGCKPGIDNAIVPTVLPWVLPEKPLQPFKPVRDLSSAVVWIGGGLVLAAVALVALLVIGLLIFVVLKVRG